jgi:hypothetical protein
MKLKQFYKKIIVFSNIQMCATLICKKNYEDEISMVQWWYLLYVGMKTSDPDQHIKKPGPGSSFRKSLDPDWFGF